MTNFTIESYANTTYYARRAGNFLQIWRRTARTNELITELHIDSIRRYVQWLTDTFGLGTGETPSSCGLPPSTPSPAQPSS